MSSRSRWSRVGKAAKPVGVGRVGLIHRRAQGRVFAGGVELHGRLAARGPIDAVAGDVVFRQFARAEHAHGDGSRPA